MRHQLFEGRINTVLGLRCRSNGHGKLLFWRDTVRCPVAPAVVASPPAARKDPRSGQAHEADDGLVYRSQLCCHSAYKQVFLSGCLGQMRHPSPFIAVEQGQTLYRMAQQSIRRHSSAMPSASRLSTPSWSSQSINSSPESSTSMIGIVISNVALNWIQSDIPGETGPVCSEPRTIAAC